MAKAKAKIEEVIDIASLIVTSPKKYLVEIKGLDSLLFNKMPDLSMPKTAKKDQTKLSHAEKEHLFWREKLYVDHEGMVYIPGENIHESMKGAAKYWGQKIAGEGNKTYTDVILKAVVCEILPIGLHKDDERIIPFGKEVNGTPNGTKKSKVHRIRPLVRPWGGTFVLHVFDARLTLDVLKVVLSYAGTFIGLCDWRPTYGRFALVDIKEI